MDPEPLRTPGGSQLSSAGGSGAWELPFVGGWDVLYEAPAGSGGIPLSTRADLSLISSRLYVWGPAEGGVSTERVLRARSAGGAAAPSVGTALSSNTAGGADAADAAGAAEAVVLVRSGSVTNLPGAEVRLDLSAPMSAYRVSSAAARSAATLDSAALTLGAAVPLNELSLQPNLDGGNSVRRTTFLSEQLWAAQLRSKLPARNIAPAVTYRSIVEARPLAQGWPLGSRGEPS